jgi:cobalt-zinc-cadmium efflux system outer membrane protein
VARKPVLASSSMLRPALVLTPALLLTLCLALGASAFVPPVQAQPTASPTNSPTASVPPSDLGRTLGGVLDYARERHPEVRAMRYEANAALERVTPAGALPDPMFQMELRDVTNDASGGSFNLLPSKVGSTRYQFRQTFPAWGRRDARRDAAQASADEAGARAEATWAEVAMRIKTTYARYQQVNALLVQNREILGLMDRLGSVAELRYAQGLAPQQDAIRAQVERTGMRGDLLMLESESNALRTRLNALMTRPTDAPLAPPMADSALPSLAQLDAAALRERVLGRNPQLRAEDARVRASERTRDAVWANRYPEFTLGVAPIQSGSRVAEWEVMFEINIPLQQGVRRAEEREALATLGENLAQLQAARQIEVLTTTSLLPQAELALQAALAGYESGKVDFSTLLEAQRQIRQARVNLIKTRAEARMRLAEIERLLGEEL